MVSRGLAVLIVQLSVVLVSVLGVESIVPKSRPGKCSVAVDFPNGYVTPNATTVNVKETVTYFCNEGFRLSGGSKRRCIRKSGKAKMKGRKPRCIDEKRLQCAIPESFKNGRVTPDDSTVINPGEKVKYICNEGFRRKGPAARTCIKKKGKAILKGKEPRCIGEKRQTCAVPVAFKNGRVTTDNRTSIDPDEKIKYVCNKGFRMSGSGVRTCIKKRGKARLKGQAPKCIDKNECRRKSPCHKHAKCKNTAGSFECICKPGYVGDGLNCKCDFACKKKGKGKCISSNLVCDGMKQCPNGRDELNCEAVTITPAPSGCVYGGKFYPPGTEISFGKSRTGCHRTYCSSEGRLISSDGVNCGQQTTPITVAPTIPIGCYHEGKFHPPGSEISSGRDGNWCYWTMCDSDGNILNADNFNCGTTQAETTTPTLPPGCQYNGKYYRPGTKISSGQSGSHCFSVHCGEEGQIIHADDFNCAEPSPSPEQPEVE